MFRRIFIVVVNIVVFCVFAELAALVIYYYQTGHLFYGHVRASRSIASTQTRGLAAGGLHPYFGPIHKPGIPFEVPEAMRSQAAPPVKTNNFGFVSTHDYPFTRTSGDQFIVGIFGGSVGVWFCQLGAERLMDSLKRNAFFARRELVPLCFSHEGYKQPQQLLLLSYFQSIGQQFDLVINIDGFNEVALGRLNDQHGFDISMPSVMHLEPLMNLVDQSTLTPEKLHSLAEIDRLKRLLNELTERIRQTRFASLHIGLEQYRKKTLADYEAELVNFAKLPSNPSSESVIYATPRLKPRDGATLFDDIARGWVSSSTLMHELLAAEHVPYFHFLQPNQYYTTRPFNEDEARVALINESPFKEGVEKGYPVLAGASGAGALKNSRVNFFDGIHIFDPQPAAVYMDNCCHYTVLGNQMLADFIAASILNTAGPWNSAAE